MKKIFLKILFLLLILSQSLNLYASFLPRNLSFSPNGQVERSTQETQELYELGTKAIKHFQIYAESSNAEFNLIFDLDNSTVNATAYKVGKIWNIKFLGGMLKHKFLTKNIFLTVLCHELGHHIGGAPYKDNKNKISVEGQADYFTTNICLKYLLEKTNLVNLMDKSPSPIAKKACKNQFSIPNEEETCLKNSLLSIEIASFLSKIGNTRRGRRNPIPKIGNRSKKVVQATTIKHPDHQCRLDTFFEGSLCNLNFGQGQQFENCEDTKIYYQGARPKCWYYSGK